ncbi:MAG: ATP-binding protein [Acidimicrobiales bacterium]
MSDDDGARDGDRVRLSLPATSAYARLARIGAASLAHRWGFAAYQVQDLRLAIDEAIILLLGGDAEHPGTIDVEYGLDGDRLSIDVIARFGDDAEQPTLDDEALDRFRTLAGELLSSYELGADKVAMEIDRQG